MSLFDTHIVVDWSARSKPSPVKPSKDAIFWSVVRDGMPAAVQYARTRASARNRLFTTLKAEKDAGRRVLIGFDFPMGYPAGVAQSLTGQEDASALWDWIDARIQDQSDNTNNRFEVASDINRHFPGLGPMWGRPATWDHPDVPTTASERYGNHPPEHRLAERMAKGAKTLWQLAYAGSVGSQTLLGLPTLQYLRRGLNAQVWPFDTGWTVPTAQIVIAEVYPSLLHAQVRDAKRTDEPLDAAQVRTLAQAFANVDAIDKLANVFVSKVPQSDQVIKEEGWILGLNHEGTLAGSLASQTSHAERPCAVPEAMHL